MADQITFNPLRAADGNGQVVAAAQARFFLSGTTTPATVYTDQSASVAHPTPLVADNRGIFPQVFSSEQLKVEVRNYSGALLPGFPIDPAPTSPPTAGAAADISFAPTAEIPFTNVQAAIERVQTNIVAPTLAFGLGVTGSAVVLANIDATTTASGTYRVDATTTGTFPAGFTASAGGIVEFRRETAASASMSLHHTGNDRQSTRKMVGGAWQAWREDLTANQTLVAGDLLYHNGTNLVRLAKGAAGQLLRQNDALTAPAWTDPITTRALQVTTSGTAFSFTTIPAWVNCVKMVFYGVSLTGTDNMIVQLGTTSGFVTSGYEGCGFVFTGGGGGIGVNSTGMFILSQSAGEGFIGHMTLTKAGSGSLRWISSHAGASSARTMNGGGSILLPSELTQIRLTRDGSNTFDAGSVSITYE